DMGREVEGGGGVEPDVKIETPKSTPLQDSLLQHYAFFNFAKHYLIGRHITADFQVDDNVMHEFRRFLEEQKIAFNEGDLIAVQDWAKSNIKSELFISEFGQQKGLEVHAQEDPEVIKALELLPKAKALAENARKIIADRNSARPVSATQ